MVANTRKMYEIKLKIREILELEEALYNKFNAFIEAGVVQGELLDEYLSISKRIGKLDEIVLVTKDMIYDNPYLKDIDITDIEYKNIRLKNKRIIKGRTLTEFGEKTRDPKTFERRNKYFICNNTLRFPAIVEGDGNIPWMTVEPVEINSFENIIDEANGNVLLIGCGLGYVAYMMSLKEEVKSITIVDLNEDILEIFNQYILPQFRNKDKIKTIKSDALEYLSSEDLTKYDYVNVDIWHDVIDMVYTYLPCLAIEKKYPNTKFSYWIEGELKECLQKNILKAIALDEEEKVELLLNAIAKDIIKNTNITCLEDIQNLLELPDLRGILYNWYINNYSLFLELGEQEKDGFKRLMKKTEYITKSIRGEK